MAQLTWRNVDAPSFSGVNDAYRLAGELMNKGLDSGRQALDGWQKDQTQIESAKLMAAAMATSDPRQLPGLLAGVNPAYVSPDALKFIAERPQDLATLAQTGVQTQGFRLGNELAAGKMPYLVNQEAQRATGMSLDNRHQGIVNDKAGFELGVQKSNRDLELDRRAKLPEWNAMQAKVEAGLGSNDPMLRSEAQGILGSKAYTELAAFMGQGPEAVTAQFGAVNGKIDAGIARNTTLDAQADHLEKRGVEKSSQAIYRDIVGRVSNAEDAQREISANPNFTPEQKRLLSTTLAADAKILFPAVDVQAVKSNVAADSISKRYNGTNPLAVPGANIGDGTAPAATGAGPFRGAERIRMSNGGATRNDDLSPTLKRTLGPILEDMDLTWDVTSGGQESNKPGQGVGSTRHNHGGAGDGPIFHKGRQLDPNDPQDIPIFNELARRAFAGGITGIGAGPGYMGGKSLHMGFGDKGVWGEKGGATAYKWLQDAYNGNAPKGSGFSFEPGGSNANAGQGPTRAAGNRQAQQLLQSAAASAELTGGKSATGKYGGEAPSPLDVIVTNEATGKASSTDPTDPSTFFNASLTASNRAIDLASANQLDSTMDVYGGLTTALTKREGKDKSPAQLAKDLFTKFGEGTEASYSMTEPNILAGIELAVKKYGLAPDVAAAFVEASVKQNVNWGWKDTRYVDETTLDETVKEFYDKGKNGLRSNYAQGASEAVNLRQSKEVVDQTIKRVQSRIQQAEKEYAEAVEQARSGNSRINVQEIRKKSEAKLASAYLELRAAASNGAVTGNQRGTLELDAAKNKVKNAVEQRKLADSARQGVGAGVVAPVRPPDLRFVEPRL